MTTKEGTIPSRPIVQEMFASTIYKRSQGRMVRQVTCLTLWVVAVAGAYRFHEMFLSGNPRIGLAAGYLIAVLLGGIGMWCAYRAVNWPRFADFLISVEAELNKVSWPTWRELNRASLVVMFTIFFMAAILFLYDLVWQAIFTALKIS
jgi:preprotein translocase subunit SecE